MAVVEVHVSVFAPEGEQAIAQELRRSRVPTVPPVVDALREVDWQLVKELIQTVADDVVKGVLVQVADYEEYLEARGTVPSDPGGISDGNGHGS